MSKQATQFQIPTVSEFALKSPLCRKFKEDPQPYCVAVRSQKASPGCANLRARFEETLFATHGGPTVLIHEVAFSVAVLVAFLDRGGLEWVVTKQTRAFF